MTVNYLPRLPYKYVGSTNFITFIQILTALVQDAQVRWSALAERLGVSAPAIADRLRRLEAIGVIAGYAAQLSGEKLGIDLTAFVSVTLEHPQYCQEFMNYVQASDRVPFRSH